MKFISKLLILVCAVFLFIYVKSNFFDSPPVKVEKKLVSEEQVLEPTRNQAGLKDKHDGNVAQETVYVTLYFLGMDKNNTSVFKKVKRQLPSGKGKLRFALEQLVNGPSAYEKKNGIYSEVPKNVKILGIVESQSKIIIDVTSNIQVGGGADSLYSRMKQFIRTALANSPDKPIYLYIDGHKAEVLGGEGIMISQPLSENSLDG